VKTAKGLPLQVFFADFTCLPACNILICCLFGQVGFPL